MRPALLNPLFAPVTALPGIGDKVARLYWRLLGQADMPRVLDLVLHMPTGVVDRRSQPKLADVRAGDIVTVAVDIESHRTPPPHRPRSPYLIQASDDTGTLTITYFSARREHMEKLLPVGSRRYVSGTAAVYDGMLQMVHPDRVADEAGLATMALVEPVYPLTEGLSAPMLRRTIGAALDRLPPVPEWLDEHHLVRNGWPAHAAALAAMHRPGEPADLAPQGIARSRLAYDELLASQLALVLVRAHLRRPAGRRRATPDATPDAGGATGRQGASLQEKLKSVLPFILTDSQRQAIREIASDLAKPHRMLRLLQGDVGSGKTVVALLACAAAIEAGHDGETRAQAALMAPTEILARQHLRTIAPLAEAAGLRVAILTGRERGRERAGILARLQDGDIDILIGTHALFQDDVVFRNLALAVVDEQHRFGVHQRLALARKGAAVDLLVMTATPIPRTLVMTYFGDMDHSELRQKPAGRKPIDTRTVPLERLDEVIAAVGRAIAQNHRVYWVCPLVDVTETVDLAAAQERYEALQQTFGADVGLVHGRLKGAEKDAAMARFAAGETRILVATTVIEVGVDVPAATVMVIEHAERFGLSQLHQLRGRIGRGAERSTCLLLYRGPLGETAKARLAVMRDTEDGFLIAEEDLRLRGGGDLLGTRQSGMPGFRIADLTVHAELLAAARDDAMMMFARDPELASARGAALRVLLYLFERDEAVRLIGAG